MDEETRAYFDQMRREFSDAQERMLKDVRDGQERLLKKVNDGQERLLNRLASLEHDFQNTKGFLINDAIVGGRRWLDLDERTSRLERDP